MKTIKKAIIPVAGFGSRFLPATKGVAKELFPIVDIPALMLVLEECLYSGIEEVLIVLCKGKESIKKFLSHDKFFEETMKQKGRFGDIERLMKVIDGLKISYSYQNPKRIGSAGAVYTGKKWAKGEPFAVLYPDDLNYTKEGQSPAILQLIKIYEKTQNMVLGGNFVSKEDVSKYSSCIIKKKLHDRLYEISGIVEKPKPGTEPSLLSCLARQIMPGNTFDYIEKQIKVCERGKEINLTETMDMISKDQPTYIVCMDAKRYDIGDKFGYLTAIVEYGLRDKKLGQKFKEYLKSLDL